jgi:hypothetical protein
VQKVSQLRGGPRRRGAGTVAGADDPVQSMKETAQNLAGKRIADQASDPKNIELFTEGRVRKPLGRCDRGSPPAHYRESVRSTQ